MFPKTTQGKLAQTRIRFVLFTVTVLINSHVLGQDKAITTSNQQWLQYGIQGELSKKGILVADVGYRWKEGFKERTAFLMRAGVGTKVNEKVTLIGGFVYAGSFLDDRLQQVEYRPYQEILLRSRTSKLEVSHRYRIEERFLHPLPNNENEGSDQFSFRFRYSLMVRIHCFNLSKIDLNKKFIVAISDEIFINAGKYVQYNIFDQNRINVSPTFELSNNFSVVLAWNSQFASLSDQAGAYRHTNIYWLQIRHKFSLIRKSKHTDIPNHVE